MITVSYKDGVWKHVSNFSNIDEAHAYAKSEGYTEYKLAKSDRPLGVYYNTPEMLENAPSVPTPEPLTPPTEPLYESANTDEPETEVNTDVAIEVDDSIVESTRKPQPVEELEEIDSLVHDSVDGKIPDEDEDGDD